MAGKHVLGVDLGTTALKAALFDVSGTVLAQSQARYEIHRPRQGWAEQNAEAWWQAFDAAVRDLHAQARLDEVRGLAICSQVNTHVFVDSRGFPLANAIVWQDRRSADEAAELGETLSGCRDRLPAGYSVDASALVSRARWAQKHEPELWQETGLVLSPKDYLNMRLTGQAATDAISSIGLVGDDGRYLEPVLDLVPGLDRVLPPIHDFSEPLGSVRGVGLASLEGATVAVATMDAWGNMYGSGVTSAGDGMEVAGTSEILGVLSADSLTAQGVVTFPPLDGLRLHAGPTQAGGAALQWFADLVGSSIAEVLRQAARAPAGSGGLVFLPYLAGERAPLWDSAARGVFFGLSADHGLEHLCRAVLEGVAFSARHLLEEIEKACGFRTTSLRLSGGGSQSDLWCQIRADVLDRSLERTHVRHSGTLGAALMAAVAAGLQPDVKTAAARAVRVERVFDPDPSTTSRYDALYAIYRDLYPSLSNAYARLADVDRPDAS